MLLTSIGYGRRVGLRVSSGHEAAVRDHLPFWWADDDVEPEREWDVPSTDAAEYVVREMELWIAEYAVDRIFVHAGVVAFDDRALLLPGRSYSGKTTLTAELLRLGGSYGSDEYAVLDTDGLVHPYPRPLSVRSEGGRRRVPAAELCAGTFREPLRVGAIAALRYEPDRAASIRSMSAALSVLRLFDNTVCAQTRSKVAFDVLATTTTETRGVEGHHNDARQIAGQLRPLI